MTNQDVLYETRDGICYITINRPQARNALGGPGLKELTDCWRRFKEDAAARVAIVSGAGDKAFCAGLDLKGVAGVRDEEDYISQFDKWGQVETLGLFPRELFLGKPIIAAINGPALGVGGVLALQCDMRVASENATIGYTLVRLGRFPAYCHEFWQLGPAAVALQSLYTGEPLTAQDAYRLGYVSAVLPQPQLMPHATSIAEKVRDNAPWAVKAIKMTWDTQPQNLNTWAQHIFHDYARRVEHTEDVKEGAQAFAERRKPRFKGK